MRGHPTTHRPMEATTTSMAVDAGRGEALHVGRRKSILSPATQGVTLSEACDAALLPPPAKHPRHHSPDHTSSCPTTSSSLCPASTSGRPACDAQLPCLPSQLSSEPPQHSHPLAPHSNDVVPSSRLLMHHASNHVALHHEHSLSSSRSLCTQLRVRPSHFDDDANNWHQQQQQQPPTTPGESVPLPQHAGPAGGSGVPLSWQQVFPPAFMPPALPSHQLPHWPAVPGGTDVPPAPSGGEARRRSSQQDAPQPLWMPPSALQLQQHWAAAGAAGPHSFTMASGWRPEGDAFWSAHTGAAPCTLPAAPFGQEQCHLSGQPHHHAFGQQPPSASVQLPSWLGGGDQALLHAPRPPPPPMLFPGSGGGVPPAPAALFEGDHAVGLLLALQQQQQQQQHDMSPLQSLQLLIAHGQQQQQKQQQQQELSPMHALQFLVSQQQQQQQQQLPPLQALQLLAAQVQQQQQPHDLHALQAIVASGLMPSTAPFVPPSQRPPLHHLVMQDLQPQGGFLPRPQVPAFGASSLRPSMYPGGHAGDALLSGGFGTAAGGLLQTPSFMSHPPLAIVPPPPPSTAEALQVLLMHQMRLGMLLPPQQPLPAAPLPTAAPAADQPLDPQVVMQMVLAAAAGGAAAPPAHPYLQQPSWPPHMSTHQAQASGYSNGLQTAGLLAAGQSRVPPLATAGRAETRHVLAAQWLVGDGPQQRYSAGDVLTVGAAATAAAATTALDKQQRATADAAATSAMQARSSGQRRETSSARARSSPAANSSPTTAIGPDNALAATSATATSALANATAVGASTAADTGAASRAVSSAEGSATAVTGERIEACRGLPKHKRHREVTLPRASVGVDVQG